MQKNKLLALLLTILFSLLCTNAFASPLEPFTGETGELRIAGGTAHIPAMKIAAAQIMTYNPNIHIAIAGGGSGVGIKQVGEGLVDIGNSGRKASTDEISRYGLTMHKWAIDGVSIVVNPNNSVRNLSQKQVSAIFAGTITNWQEVGGADAKINLYTRDAGSGTRAVFWKKALNKGAISPRANFVISNGAMKAAISQDRNSIGYVSVGHLNDSIAAVAFNGIKPSLENVKSGQYPIARGLYSNTKGNPSGLAKKLIDFLLTPAGQKIITENGFVSVK